MKGDFSRDSFDATRHYRSVRMQQGRVQLDADWNEQSDIGEHVAEATTADIVGPCGAPENLSAFHVVTDIKNLTPQEKKLPQNVPANPLQAGDFYLSAGHYYVHGILCENEQIVAYTSQPDLSGLTPLPLGQYGVYVVYLDVWQRHITAIDDPRLREVALGGPDTATRAKTVWQVKVWYAGEGAAGDCSTDFTGLGALLAAPTGKLRARPRQEIATTDPCLVPPSAGYRGLENQLYRVEIHAGGTPFDVSAGGANEVPVLGLTGTNKVQCASSLGLAVGNAIELFLPSAPMNAQLAFVTNVTNVNAQTIEATVSSEIAGFKIADNPRLRHVTSLFKWSRDNGSVVTAITKIDGADVSVHDLGPDDVLGFAPDQWVEISDDNVELKGLSGPLVQIATVTPGQTPKVTLKAAPGVVLGANPKLRRWDGAAAIKLNSALPGLSWLELENGVQIQFADGTYRTQDYWQIPARAASADAESGNIQWPRDNNGPVFQAPAGIQHHYCRLAVVQVGAETITSIDDCRSLFPPLTDLTTLVYIGGDGQEAMPGDPLPQPLVAGVFNGRRAVKGRNVRFTTTGAGKVASNNAGLATATATVTITTGPDGLASCAWLPDPAVLDQQVEAHLLDAASNPLPPLLRFSAQLSVASQVAYDPAQCPDLKAARTVQQAIDLLCKAAHGGCEVVVGAGGQFATIADAVKAIIDMKRLDLCLCLLPGDYPVTPGDLAPLDTLAKNLVRLTIAGCGQGSRLRFTGDTYTHTGWQLLTLRNLSVRFEQRRAFAQFGEVVIDGCDLFTAASNTAIPLEIRNAARVRITNSVIEGPPPATAPTVFSATPLEALFADRTLDRNDFTQKALDVVSKLTPAAAKPDRDKIIAKIAPQAAVTGTPTAAQPLFARLQANLTSDTTGEEWVNNLLALRAALGRPTPFVVLVVTGAAGDVLLDNNDIQGAISFYGPVNLAADRAPLGNLLTAIAKALQNNFITLLDAGGVLRIRGNRLGQVYIGDELLSKQLGPAAAQANADHPFQISGLFRAIFLEENLMEMLGNELVASRLAIATNTFAPLVPRGLLGAAVADRASFVGNLGPASETARFFNYAASTDVVNQQVRGTVTAPGTTPPNLVVSAGNAGMVFNPA